MLFWKQSFWLIKPFSSGPLNFTKLHKPVLEKCPSSLGEAPVFNFTVLRVLSDFSLCLTLSNLVDCSLPWDSPGKNNGVQQLYYSALPHVRRLVTCVHKIVTAYIRKSVKKKRGGEFFGFKIKTTRLIIFPKCAHDNQATMTKILLSDI